MQQSRRRFLLAAGTSLAIAGCQDGGAPTPAGSPDGADDVADEQDATPVPGEGEEEGTDARTDTGDTDEADAADETGGGEDGTGTGDGSDAAVAVRDHEAHGEILVDGEGVTLYVFDEDAQGAGQSTCTGECAESWPPFVTAAGGEPEVGEGVEAEITTFERADGDTQVAANGWPLYTFVQDEQPGDANGQGVNEVWWVVDPSGEPVQDGTETGADGGT